MAADWLSDAIVHEIHPQSYADSDGDGIGDLRGVIERLTRPRRTCGGSGPSNGASTATTAARAWFSR